MTRQKADKKSVDKVYTEIREYELKNIWNKLSNRDKVKFYLLYNFRFLLDFIIIKRIEK